MDAPAGVTKEKVNTGVFILWWVTGVKHCDTDDVTNTHGFHVLGTCKYRVALKADYGISFAHFFKSRQGFLRSCCACIMAGAAPVLARCPCES